MSAIFPSYDKIYDISAEAPKVAEPKNLVRNDLVQKGEGSAMLFGDALQTSSCTTQLHFSMQTDSLNACKLHVANCVLHQFSCLDGQKLVQGTRFELADH